MRGRKDHEKAVVAVESEGFVNPHGRILMHDDFEDTPLKWTGVGSGTLWQVSRRARAAYNGSFGAEMDITSDIPPGSRYVTMNRLIPIDVTKRLRTELFWRINDLTILEHMRLYMIFYDGARRHTAAIDYRQATGRWQYHNDVALFVDIPGGAQTFYPEAWNELTLDADFASDHYIRMKSNNLEFNLGGIPCENFISGLGGHLHIYMTAWDITGNQLLIHLDEIIVKELEV